MSDHRGRALLETTTPQEWLDAEPHTPLWDRLDSLLARLAVAALRGNDVIDIVRDIDDVATEVRIVGLPYADRALLNEQYSLSRQQSDGAWYIPDKVKGPVGLATLPPALRVDPLHGFSTITEDNLQLTAVRPDHLFLWSALLPFLERLLVPLTLRSGLPGGPRPDALRAALEDSVASYAALGLDGGDALAVMAYGGDWGRLSRTEQAHQRLRLLAHLVPQVTEEVAARHRALLLWDLTADFYKKIKKNTSPLARQVLNKRTQPLLSGYFHGSWPALLDYLGEDVNPGDEIITQLPDSRLYVGDSQRVDEVAQAQGIDVADVAAVLAAFTGQSTTQTPIEERLQVVRAWWKEYDAIHARQTSKMRPLWGLVDDGCISVTHNNPAMMPTARLYEQVLSESTLTAVRKLWSVAVLPQWPERLVVEPHPHAALARLLGPALRFWDGVSLTAWYVTEGPSSRTTIGGLEHDHRKDLAALAELGTPIGADLFRDLNQAAERLGPEQEVRTPNTQSRSHNADNGITIEYEMFHTRIRRDGFEHLREVITHHRRRWATAYLDTYLKDRWQRPLSDLARTFEQSLAARGKPPATRQFATGGAPIANAWFAGRLDSVAAAIGQRANLKPSEPPQPLPYDVDLIAQYVYKLLRGQADVPSDSEGWMALTAARNIDKYLQKVAVKGEAIARRDVGLDYSDEDDRAQALWERYQRAVAQALATDVTTVQTALQQRSKTPPAPTPRRGDRPSGLPDSRIRNTPVEPRQAPPDRSVPEPDVPKRGLLARLFSSLR